MKTEISYDRLHIVILDISGLYTQIHDEMWISEVEYEQIKFVYKDKNKWRIILI